jgi:hypothetical protein
MLIGLTWVMLLLVDVWTVLASFGPTLLARVDPIPTALSTSAKARITAFQGNEQRLTRFTGQPQFGVAGS